MDPVGLDIDVELEELETRLERLRALYEQYFLGIEKIEPTVARKDVDRRIWLLRREKIRNTGRRFKFQVLIQRYNTFQQYWQRICREIDNGTYKRHMLRAEKILGTQALTIAAKRRQGAFARRPEDEAAALAEQEAAKQRAEAERLRAEVEEAEQSRQREIDTLLGVRARPPSTNEPVRPPTSPKPVAAQGKPARPKLVLERLDLDIDDLLSGGKGPISSRPPPRPKTDNRPIAEKPAPGAAPPAEAPRAPVRKQPPPFPPRAGAPQRLPAAPDPPKAPAPAAPKPPPAPVRPVTSPTPARGPDVAKAPASSAGVTDQRMKELHARLVDAKRQLNDPRAVSLDGLTKQLRQAEDSLRRQHGNRRIDFDVVIKDGKAVVKPVLK